jgi:hypothetical protein
VSSLPPPELTCVGADPEPVVGSGAVVGVSPFEHAARMMESSKTVKMISRRVDVMFLFLLIIEKYFHS